MWRFICLLFPDPETFRLNTFLVFHCNISGNAAGPSNILPTVWFNYVCKEVDIHTLRWAFLLTVIYPYSLCCIRLAVNNVMVFCVTVRESHLQNVYVINCCIKIEDAIFKFPLGYRTKFSSEITLKKATVYSLFSTSEWFVYL